MSSQIDDYEIDDYVIDPTKIDPATLPPELLWNVMMSLDFKSLQEMCISSQYLADWCSRENDRFWTARYKQDFGQLGYNTEWKKRWENQKITYEQRNKMFEQAMDTCDERIMTSLYNTQLYPGYKTHPRQVKRVIEQGIDKMGERCSDDYVIAFLNVLHHTARAPRDYGSLVYNRLIRHKRFALVRSLMEEDKFKINTVNDVIINAIHEYIDGEEGEEKEQFYFLLTKIFPRNKVYSLLVEQGIANCGMRFLSFAEELGMTKDNIKYDNSMDALTEIQDQGLECEDLINIFELLFKYYLHPTSD